MLRLENGRGFALLTRVFEGYESPKLHYQEVSFPEAHAELVCICPEDPDEQTREIIKLISRRFRQI